MGVIMIPGAQEVPFNRNDFCCTWNSEARNIRVDCRTLGVLVLYTQGVATDWVDLIITDVALAQPTAERIAALETEMGAPLSELEIARKEYDRGHAEVLFSSSFMIIRLCRPE
jgi:hypothetical protein